MCLLKAPLTASAVSNYYAISLTMVWNFQTKALKNKAELLFAVKA